MDTFFATKKGGQSSQGHTCCQLFVTDKGFIYVVPMKKKSEVLLAIKQFAKEIGAPDSFVADMSGEQMSSEVKKVCNDIGTTIRALEEGTPWSNKAELYIGLIKEAVRKDMHESNSPLCFWDCCVERRARINNLTAKNAFRLHGSTPHTLTTGDEGNILNLCQYDGMNGVTSGIKLQYSPTTRKFWEEYLARPEAFLLALKTPIKTSPHQSLPFHSQRWHSQEVATIESWPLLQL